MDIWELASQASTGLIWLRGTEKFWAVGNTILQLWVLLYAGNWKVLCCWQHNIATLGFIIRRELKSFVLLATQYCNFGFYYTQGIEKFCAVGNTILQLWVLLYAGNWKVLCCWQHNIATFGFIIRRELKSFVLLATQYCNFGFYYTQEIEKFCAVGNTILQLWVLLYAGNFLIGWQAIALSWTTLLIS